MLLSSFPHKIETLGLIKWIPSPDNVLFQFYGHAPPSDNILQVVFSGDTFNPNWKIVQQKYHKNSVVIIASTIIHNAQKYSISQLITWISRSALSASATNLCLVVSESNAKFSEPKCNMGPETIHCGAFNIFTYSPVWKLAIKLYANGHIESTTVMCADMCRYKSFAIPPAQLGHIDLASVHKNLFFGGSEIPVFTYIPWLNFKFYKESKVKIFTCDTIYKRRQYWLLKDAYACYGKQMLAMQLSLVHNISFVRSTDDATSFNLIKPFLSFDIQPWPESLTNIKYDVNRFLKTSFWLEGAIFQYVSGYTFIYCNDQSKLTRDGKPLSYGQCHFQPGFGHL